jgi:hypothetical protein
VRTSCSGWSSGSAHTWARCWNRGLIEREKLERLCRYISRPAVATGHLALSASGQVRDALKTAYRAGTTHLVLEPLELMARLAALVPRPQPNQPERPLGARR